MRGMLTVTHQFLLWTAGIIFIETLLYGLCLNDGWKLTMDYDFAADTVNNAQIVGFWDRLCGLVVKVPDYRFRGPGLIPGATRFF
jgi:hypothetical protein